MSVPVWERVINGLFFAITATTAGLSWCCGATAGWSGVWSTVLAGKNAWCRMPQESGENRLKLRRFS